MADKRTQHVAVPAVEARAEDVGTIEAIVLASYETISGGVGVPRQWGRDRSLYDPAARFVAVRVNPESGALTARSLTHQGYVDATDSFLVKEGFTERELAHTIHRYGNVATVLSSYEGKIATGRVITRGVNIFQLYFDGKRWWILSMVWDEERPGNLHSSRASAQAGEQVSFAVTAATMSGEGASAPQPCVQT